MPVCYGEESSYPIEMEISSDSELSVSDEGRISSVHLIITNVSDEGYELFSPVISGDLLDKKQKIHSGNKNTDVLFLSPHESRELLLRDLKIPDGIYDESFSFVLSWKELFPEDSQPSIEAEEEMENGKEYVARNAHASFLLDYSYADTLSVRAVYIPESARIGEQVRLQYLLENKTANVIENISLYDNETPIELPADFLEPGESMKADYQLTMGQSDTVVSVGAYYYVNGREFFVSCEDVSISPVNVLLTLSVRQYTAEDGNTILSISVTNAGTHIMRMVRIADNKNRIVSDSFNLSSGQTKIVDYVPDTDDSGKEISFKALASDWNGQDYQSGKTASFIVPPSTFEKGQVSLQMNVRLAGFDYDTNTAKLVFEIRNYSGTDIFQASVFESAIVHDRIAHYDSLTKGIITLNKEFSVSPDTGMLTFTLEAYDAGGNRYLTDPVSINVSTLAFSGETGPVSFDTGSVISTGGTLFDTDSAIRKTSYLALTLTAFGLLLLIIATYYNSNEKKIRELLIEKGSRDTAQIDAIPRDTARVKFGYKRPVKLRYGENTAQIETKNGEAEKGEIETDTSISTGTYQKPQKSIRMLTREDTRVFSVPVFGSKPSAVFTKEPPIQFHSDDTAGINGNRQNIANIVRKEIPDGADANLSVLKSEARVSKIKEEPRKYPGCPYSFEIKRRTLKQTRKNIFNDPEIIRVFHRPE